MANSTPLKKDLPPFLAKKKRLLQVVQDLEQPIRNAVACIKHTPTVTVASYFRSGARNINSHELGYEF